MKMFYIEVPYEDMEKVSELIYCFEYGVTAVVEPIYGQYCTRFMEIGLDEKDIKGFYEMLRLEGIKNYLKEVA